MGSLFKRDGSENWYAGNGKRKERSTRTTSRADAERIMRKWVERASLEREGLVKPEGGTELDRHAAATIASHLDAFDNAKRSEGRTDRHIAETRKTIEEAAKGCGWRALGDIAPDGLERYIGRRRAPDDEAERSWTPRTAHKCITAIRTFTRWCVSDGRLSADPIARVRKPSPVRQRERRFLSVDEWRWLRTVTDQGSERMGMDGHARRLLYELAIQTGFRSSELRAFTRSSLMLDADRPYVLLEARQTKNGKAARQYVRPELARDLAGFVTRTMPGAPVFTMPRREHVATMLRADLDAARAAWLAEAGIDAQERIKREASDFLRAEDHDGRVLDFHALRHTCGAWAAMGGASPKAIQTLMRHSKITLTLDTYGHLLPDEAAETVARMPSVEPLPLRLTGTADDAADGASNSLEVPATSPATRERFGATQRDAVPHPKTKNAPGVLPRAVFKRGGRDSNPQPPDRQSGDRFAKCFSWQEVAPLRLAGTATTTATDSDDTDLSRVTEAWSRLPADVRTTIMRLVAACEGASDDD